MLLRPCTYCCAAQKFDPAPLRTPHNLSATLIRAVESLPQLLSVSKPSSAEFSSLVIDRTRFPPTISAPRFGGLETANVGFTEGIDRSRDVGTRSAPFLRSSFLVRSHESIPKTTVSLLSTPPSARAQLSCIVSARSSLQNTCSGRRASEDVHFFACSGLQKKQVGAFHAALASSRTRWPPAK